MENDPLAQFGLGAIDLRWTLKDIASKRSWMINQTHLAQLIELGLVEMHEDVPHLTIPGQNTVWETYPANNTAKVDRSSAKTAVDRTVSLPPMPTRFERGEVATQQNNPRHMGHVQEQKIPATTDQIGLTQNEVHEAHIGRGAENADPGIVRRSLDNEGEQPKQASAAPETAPIASSHKSDELTDLLQKSIDELLNPNRPRQG